MPSINLAPGTEFIIAARKRRQRLYIAVLVIVAISGVGFGVLFFMEQSLTGQNEALKNNIQVANAKIDQSQADALRVSLFEKRLTETKSLLDAHVKWDQAFADIERLLPPATVLTNVDMGTDSAIVAIQGTTPDMDTVAQTIASLSAGPNHASMFRDGRVKVVSRSEQKNGDQTSILYTFTITLTIDPNKLHTSVTQ